MPLGRWTYTVALGAAFSVGVLVASPASAHDSTAPFDKHLWLNNGVNEGYYFHNSIPDLTDWRNSIRFGDDVWEALGVTTVEPDFIAQTRSATGYQCSASGIGTSRSAVSYGPVGSNYLAQTTYCLIGPAARPAEGFNITFDSALPSPFTAWYIGSGTPGSTQADLRSVATHEMGHASGFFKHWEDVGVITEGCFPPGDSVNWTMCNGIPAGVTYPRSLNTHDAHTFTNAY